MTKRLVSLHLSNERNSVGQSWAAQFMDQMLEWQHFSVSTLVSKHISSLTQRTSKVIFLNGRKNPGYNCPAWHTACFFCFFFLHTRNYFSLRLLTLGTTVTHFIQLHISSLNQRIIFADSWFGRVPNLSCTPLRNWTTPPLSHARGPEVQLLRGNYTDPPPPHLPSNSNHLWGNKYQTDPLSSWQGLLLFFFLHASHPPDPSCPSLSRSGEGPLGGAGGGGGGRLTYSLIGHDSGGELGLGLLEAGVGLPVQAVDLKKGKSRARWHLIHAAVHHHIMHIVRGENDTHNLISGYYSDCLLSTHCFMAGAPPGRSWLPASTDAA